MTDTSKQDEPEATEIKVKPGASEVADADLDEVVGGLMSTGAGATDPSVCISRT